MATTFDWKSLIPQAAALGSAAIGPPTPDLMGAQTNQQQAAFNQQLARTKLGQQGVTRSAALPGMFANLGYTPDQAQSMTSQYGKVPLPTATTGAGTPGSGPGLGSKIGGAAMGLAPALLGAIHGGAAASEFVGPTLSMLGGVGPTAPAAASTGLLGMGSAIPIAGAVIGGALLTRYLWKRSQAHPTADKWVQGEQNPFDKSMADLDSVAASGKATPEETAQAKQQNAANYLQELQAFAQKGGHEAIVAKQAADTFRQYYGDPMRYGVQLGF